ncbi:MmcQ/YjbR family DNA-binding protein [Nocardioides zeae]|uniref:MmcQ/YjbR family DNA-binding protein n=1 Tax=Nocardioides imazamoxiresistens TaxID=3231893 RepID=A0ABU3PRC4_9ACTN|nr:MmcQ/YjbR family DNA-binding protein [Nocardioides zeae]MDT9591769.1 MmcQ/YjbR family DNA-binding protein [Nocardioides zeae]
MAHVIPYDDSHPWFERVRALARAYPRVTEDDSHGRPTFRVGRVFCVLGNEERRPDGSRVPRPRSLAVRIDPVELPALDADDRFFEPRFWYAHGWRGVDLDPGRVTFEEVAELVDASYRLLAPRGALAELDARG